MKAMICEVCGSYAFTKARGHYICDQCGMKYAPEEANKLLVEHTDLYCLNCKEHVKREYDLLMVAIGAAICVAISAPTILIDNVMAKIWLHIIAIAVGASFIYKFQYRCPRCHGHSFRGFHLK